MPSAFALALFSVTMSTNLPLHTISVIALNVPTDAFGANCLTEESSYGCLTCALYHKVQTR